MTAIIFIYFGERYRNKSNGVFGTLVNATDIAPAAWEDVCQAIARGMDVRVRPADADEHAFAEANLVILHASRQAAST